jgi:hypothetical protein
MINLTIVKRISWWLLLVIIGFFIALVYLHFKNRESQFAYAVHEGVTKPWTRLEDKKAKDIMRNYLGEQDNIWPNYFRLRTGREKKVLRGFYLDKVMLDSIVYVADSLKQKIDGFHIYMGKWDTANKRYYSLVVRGAGKPLTSKDTSGGAVGPYFDMVEPCPDNCGEDEPGYKK